MAVKIRLRRYGRKKIPTYRVVVTDQRAKRDGRVIEAIGSYDPRKETGGTVIKQERVAYWIGKGAQPTRTVAQMLKRVAKGA
ncbi:MAG: 30S ribosomal protein S16 [Pseudomonadota bacterium]